MPGKTPLVATEYGPATVGRRRLTNLGVFLVVGSAAAAVGYLPWEAPAILLPWIVTVWVAGSAISRATSAARSQWMETASYCLDALWLTAVCYYLGGADWIASAFYVLLVITAAASLPMPRAALVAATAWIGFAFLALGEATGVLRLPIFGSPAGNEGTIAFAIVTVVIQATTLILALLLQQELLGALRRSEARHRAILNAASDMVVVLDDRGIIQRTSEVFAERTAFPIRGLVGTPFENIVDSEHRHVWTRVLASASSGERASFELAYRSTHANQGWIGGTLVPLPPEEGEGRVLMIARDVSAERMARKVVARAPRMVSAG